MDTTFGSNKTKKSSTRSIRENNRERGKKTKRRLFSLIAQSEPSGKTTGELEKELHLHRDRVHTICKEYINKDLIYKTGKRGKYHLGSKSLNDPTIGGFLFHRNAMKEFFRFEHLPSDNRLFDRKYIEKIILSRKRKGVSFLHSPTEDKLDLFDFVMRVGIILTFAMIKAFESRPHPEIADYLSSVSRDDLVWKWMEKAITLQSLLNAFTEVWPIYKRLKCNKVANEQEYKGSMYEMDRHDVNSLKEAFETIFPDAYGKLEGIAQDLPRQIESKKQEWRRYSKA